MTSRPPLLNNVLRWFLFAMVLANIASQMLFAFLPLYLAELGATVGQIGLVFSVAALVPLALQILGGWLSDSIGRLRTIAIGAVSATLGYFVLAAAPTWHWAMLGLGLEYISGSLVGPSFGAFIADQSAEENRGRVFGVAHAIFVVVGVVGPPLGGLLAGRYGFRPMLWVAFVLYAAAAVLRVWMAGATRFGGAPSGERPRLESLRSNLSGMFALLSAGGVLAWVLITDGVRDVSMRLSADLQPLYFSRVGGLSTTEIGAIGSVTALSVMLVAWPAGWLSDKHGERTAIAGGFGLLALGISLFLRAQDLAGFASAAVVSGGGIGLMGPAFESLVSKVTPEKMRGLAYGLFQTSLGLVSLPAPWVGALLWERISPKAPFAVTALAALAVILPVWIKFPLPRQPVPEPVEA